MSEAYTEKTVVFSAHDGKKIYGDFVKTKKRVKGLVIFAHGLPSWRNDYTYLNSSRELARQGYDCLRMSFYDWQKGARCLTDCDLSTHVSDLETAIGYFRRKYEKIYLIGHSWGGLTIMHSACKGVAAVSLWDPSYMPNSWWKDFSRNHKGLTFGKGAVEFLLSKKMHDQALSLDKKACRALARKFTTPMQVLHATKKNATILHKLGESYNDFAKGPVDYHRLPEADHSFLAESAQQKAIRLTVRWFEKFR